MRKAPGFESAALFKKVMAILASQPYRLQSIRFTVDLFDRSLLRQIVLEEGTLNSARSSDEYGNEYKR